MFLQELTLSISGDIFLQGGGQKRRKTLSILQKKKKKRGGYISIGWIGGNIKTGIITVCGRNITHPQGTCFACKSCLFSLWLAELKQTWRSRGPPSTNAGQDRQHWARWSKIQYNSVTSLWTCAMWILHLYVQSSGFYILLVYSTNWEILEIVVQIVTFLSSACIPPTLPISSCTLCMPFLILGLGQNKLSSMHVWIHWSMLRRTCHPPIKFQLTLLDDRC